MSTTPARRTRNRVLGVVAAIAMAGAAALALAPNSGANFTSSKQATMQANTGNASITLSDASHTATCVMNFGTVNPGGTGAATCTVKNTGTTPLHITVSAVGTPSIVAPHATPVNTIDPTKYFVAVDGYLSATALNAFTTPVMLGDLNPGDSRTYSVTFAVDNSVGNEGQDMQLGIGVTITGTQFS